MALSNYGRNNTLSETCFRTLTHPLTNLICIIVAAPVGFMLVILIDPAEIASRLKARSATRDVTVGRSESAAGGWQARGDGWSLTFQRKHGLTRGAARSRLARPGA